MRERAHRVLENYAKDCKEFREDCIKTYGVPSPDLLSDPDYKGSGEEKNCIELSCDKSSEKISKEITCSKTDAVFLALLSFVPEFEELNDLKLIQSDATVEPPDNAAGDDIEIKYNGDTYTNVSIEKYYLAAFHYIYCVGVRFSAEKNKGVKAEYCLFPQNPYNITSNMRDYDRGEVYYITNGDDSPLPTFSAGIVEVSDERMYVGSLKIPGDYTIEPDPNDEDTYFSPIDVAVLVYVFWEKGEKGFSFSTLRSGKLDKKISKTDSAVTFCNTVPLSAQMHNRGIEYDAISNIVFKKEGKKCVRQV